MNSMTKIALGALATTALAWWLNGPMGFGANCAAAAGSGAAVTAPLPAAPTATVPEKPATAAAVADCQTKVNATIQGKTVNFTTGHATIAPESMALIEALATELKACAGTAVEVQGHTDSTGSHATNQALSEARAKAVADSLTAKGVPAERLTAKGYAETVPLDPAKTPAAYAKNRRIEFKVAMSGAAAASAAGQ